MERKSKVSKLRRIVRLVVVVLALCAGMLFAVADGMATAEAKQAVNLAKSQMRLVKGEKVRLSLRGAKGKAVWKSTNTAIATVDKNGTVKAKKSGKAKIRVKYQKKTYQCTVWVEAPKLNKKSLTLKVGEKASLKISGTKQNVFWSSGQKKVVSVNKKGVVTAKKKGTATITAKVGTKKYQCKVTVKTNDKKPESGEDSKYGGLKVWLEEGNVVPMGQEYVTIVVENPTDTVKMLACGYDLWMKQDGKWVVAPVNFVFPCMMEEIQPKEILKTRCYLVDPESGEKCQPGEYRVDRGESVEFQIVEDEDPLEGLTISSKDGDVVPVGQPYLTVEIKNHSVLEKSSSRGYVVERNVDGEWVTMPLNYIFTDDIVPIKAGGVWEIQCPLKNSEGYFAPGQYRFRKYGFADVDLIMVFEIAKDTKPSSEWKVQLEEGSQVPINQKEVTLVVENTTDTPGWLTYGYTLEQKQSGQWVAAPVQFHYDSLVEEVEAQKTNKIRCCLEDGGQKCQPGEYRVSRGDGISAEFQILAEERQVPDTSSNIEAWLDKGNELSASKTLFVFWAKNNTDVAEWITNGYLLYQKQGDEWVLSPANLKFKDKMEELRPGESKMMYCSLGVGEKKCPPGEYKVCRGSKVCIEFRVVK